MPKAPRSAFEWRSTGPFWLPLEFLPVLPVRISAPSTRPDALRAGGWSRATTRIEIHRGGQRLRLQHHQPGLHDLRKRPTPRPSTIGGEAKLCRRRHQTTTLKGRRCKAFGRAEVGGVEVHDRWCVLKCLRCPCDGEPGASVVGRLRPTFPCYGDVRRRLRVSRTCDSKGAPRGLSTLFLIFLCEFFPPLEFRGGKRCDALRLSCCARGGRSPSARTDDRAGSPRRGAYGR